MGKMTERQKRKKAGQEKPAPAQMKMLVRTQGFDVEFATDEELAGSVFQMTFHTNAGDIKVQMPESGAQAVVEAVVLMIEKRSKEATLVGPGGEALVD